MATCLSCLRPTRARPTPRRVQRSSGILHLHGEPRSITSGENSSTVSVSVTTSGDTAQIGTGPVGDGRFLARLSAQLAVFDVVVLVASSRRKSRWYLVAPMVLMLLLLVACGRSGQSPVYSNETPPGTYKLNITAT
jgi:hypothetical protein